MALVDSYDMLQKAKNGGYAVGAFNIENMEMAQAVIKAAVEENSPVIIQTTPGTVSYAGLELYYANVATLAERAPVPVVFHLDHGNSFDLAMQAIRVGYTSIMIDGSKLSFDENIELAARVVAVARPNRIPVEAELGMLGGKEDGMDGGAGSYTDPDQAKEFAERSGVSSLAVAIGTAHGVYKGEPVLDKNRLKEINQKVEIPLVLHGASGLSEKDVKDCIKHGIAKVNFATELRIAYTQGVKEAFEANDGVIDPKVYGHAGRQRVEEVVRKAITTCGSHNKA